MSARISKQRWSIVLIVAALAAAGALTAFNVTPAASQGAGMVAYAVPSDAALDDPWSSAWDGGPTATVILSAQNATKPLGGGEVATIKTWGRHDGSTLYLMLEWKDRTLDDTVNGHLVFADAAAVELPTKPGVSIPSFCMGDANGTVNVWHWKAAWQRDIDDGFTAARDRYPDGFVDGYPFAADPAFSPARSVGNPLAQLDHASPVENLVAANFGTLTNADLQDVGGNGAWKKGTWRVVFSRPMTTGSGYPTMAVGDLTNVAFAVWDGSKGNRDGLKSVSQFMNLQISTSAVPTDGGGFSWIVWVGAGAAALAFTGGLIATFARLSKS